MSLLVKLFIILPVYFAYPEISIVWNNVEHDRVNVKAQASHEFFEQCLQSGLEVRYRFRLQLCKRRPAWFDSCKTSRLIVHRLAFDPISESYKVTSDVHGDGKEPISSSAKTIKEAFEVLSVAEDVPLEYLARGDKRFVRSKRAYMNARISSGCHGGYNKTLATISSVLTLGLVDISGFDSGWQKFVFRPEQESSLITRESQ